MEVKAALNNYRISPQKARLVADQIRGKAVEDALEILTFSSKAAVFGSVRTMREFPAMTAPSLT